VWFPRMYIVLSMAYPRWPFPVELCMLMVINSKGKTIRYDRWHWRWYLVPTPLHANSFLPYWPILPREEELSPFKHMAHTSGIHLQALPFQFFVSPVIN